MSPVKGQGRHTHPGTSCCHSSGYARGWGWKEGTCGCHFPKHTRDRTKGIHDSCSLLLTVGETSTGGSKPGWTQASTISAPLRARLYLAGLGWWVETQQVIHNRVITVPIPILCAGVFIFLSSRLSALYVDGISNSSEVIHDPATTAEPFVYSQQMGLVSVSQITF